MDGADAAGMASAPCFEEVERLSAAHLADGNAVRTKAERGANEIGERRNAILGPQSDKVGRQALEFARILDQNDAVGEFGDFR